MNRTILTPGSLALLICLRAVPALALSPGLPPGNNFDLSHWYLTLPADSSGGTSGTAVDISAAQLVAGYTNAPYFYTGGDGAMVFHCPAKGATTSGSSNPRTELREQLNTNDNAVDWSANGMSILTAQCKVTAIASGGEMGIAQVHGYNVDIPLVILYYDNSQNKGTIDATVKYKTDNKTINGSTDKTLTFANVGLNNLINYQIVVSNGVAIITVNGITRSQNFYATDTNWAKVNFYFKAGDYYTDNGGTSQASQVSFYSLTASHPPADPLDLDQVVLAASRLTFSGDGGPTNGTYYVLASTNLNLPLAEWTPVATNHFDKAGDFSLTNYLHGVQPRFFIIRLR